MHSVQWMRPVLWCLCLNQCSDLAQRLLAPLDWNVDDRYDREMVEVATLCCPICESLRRGDSRIRMTHLRWLMQLELLVVVVGVAVVVAVAVAMG